MLEARLNADVPCASRHSVANLCVHAWTSDLWLDMVTDWRCQLEQQRQAGGGGPARAPNPGSAFGSVPAAVASANLFLLETSVNDAASLFSANGERAVHGNRDVDVAAGSGAGAARQYNDFGELAELLLLQLQSFPARPAVAFLGVSSVRQGRRRGGGGDQTGAPASRGPGALTQHLLVITHQPAPRPSTAPDQIGRQPRLLPMRSLHPSAAPAQQAAARHHGVPYVSVLDALGPLVGSHWFEATYRLPKPDWCHITRLAHAAAGLMLAHGLQAQLDAWGAWGGAGVAPPTQPGPGGGSPQPQPQPPLDPLFASPDVVAMYATARPLRFPATLDFRDARFRGCPPGGRDCAAAAAGWDYAVEPGGKAGLVSRTVGAVLGYHFDAAMLQQHARNGVLHVQALRSYEHMARMRVDLVTPPNHTLASSTFDCAWAQPSSQGAELAVPFDAAAALAAGSLAVALVNLGGGDENKLKVMALTLM